MNRATALTLRIGVVAGTVLLIAGMAASSAGMDTGITEAGIAVIIVSPFAGALVTFAFLLKEKDMFWAGIAAVLIAVTVAGILLSLRRTPPKTQKRKKKSGAREGI